MLVRAKSICATALALKSNLGGCLSGCLSQEVTLLTRLQNCNLKQKIAENYWLR
jgi:hypothetical protein